MKQALQQEQSLRGNVCVCVTKMCVKIKKREEKKEKPCVCIYVFARFNEIQSSMTLYRWFNASSIRTQAVRANKIDFSETDSPVMQESSSVQFYS